MSDTEGRDREVRDEPVNEDARAGGEERRQESYKCFVGGISWHLDDHKLKEGETGDEGASGLRSCAAVCNFPAFRLADASRQHRAAQRARAVTAGAGKRAPAIYSLCCPSGA